MDVVVIFNGLGNQMSQYAFYLQKKNIDASTHFIFDRRSLSNHNGYELAEVFNIKYKKTFVNYILFLTFRMLQMSKYPFFSRPIQRILNLAGISLISEDENHDYDEKLMIPSKGIRFFYGGWHSEKYFKSNRQQIENVFKLDVNDEVNLNLLKKINALNSVSLHVRRGDYTNKSNFAKYGSVCTKEYFEKAVASINESVANPHFFIFSDDFEWVNKNLKLESYTIVDCNKGSNSWKDIFLMSKCKHNINSNSTFSWWGAWLNKNKNKTVYVPKYFINNLKTKDFYPESWIKIVDY